MVVNILTVRNREGDGISVLYLELSPLAHHIACLVLLLLIHFQFRLIDNVPDWVNWLYWHKTVGVLPHV